MPIFTQPLQKIDETNPTDAIKKMANHIKYIQEQLEYTLLNLDSRNINEIDTSKTTITDNTGNASIGSTINMTGSKGERFTVGNNSKGQFEFTIYDGKGDQAIYLNSSTGELIITDNVPLTIDGGIW